VGDEVAPHAIDVDQRLHAHLLGQSGVLALGGVVSRVHVGTPAHRLVGHAHRLEDFVVEPVLAGQALGHVGEEQARLGPLDDAVVIGRGDGHHLAEAELGDHAWVGGLEAGGVRERPDADDRPLAGHEARHRLGRPSVPGLVSDTVVPEKSSGVALLEWTFRTSSS